MTHADIVTMLNQGAALHRQGKLEEARAHYQAVLARDPDQADALHLLGGVEKAQGRLDRAIALIRKAIEASPREPVYWSNLAAALLDAGQAQAALEASAEALARLPDLAEAHRGRAMALHRLGDLAEGAAAAARAVALAPRDALSWNLLGAFQRRLGRQNDARESYRRALALRPDYPEALNNLAVALLDEGLAGEAETLLRRAATLAPGSAETFNNLGKAQQLQGKSADAARSYGQALKQHPDKPLWRIRQAAVCPVIAPSKKAIALWRRRFLETIAATPRLDLADCVDELESAHAAPSYHLAYQGEDNLELKSRFADLFDNSWPPLEPVDPTETPLRILFLATTGHEGVFLKCTRGVIQRWGASGAELTIAGHAPGIERIRAQTEPSPARFLTLPRGMAAAVETLRRQRFHLAYFWEVGSDALNYFLPFFRVAPVQCTSWGTSETTGSPAIDHYLSCRLWEDEAAQAFYREKLTLLDRVPICYQPPARRDRPRTKADFGFDPRWTVYFCAQNLFKIHPDFDELVAKLLDRDRRARLVMVEGKQPHWTALLERRFRRRLGALADRALFLPRQGYADYLDLTAAADATLDSRHFSGGATSYEALSLGAPVVTLPGRFMRGRFTLGCYRAMGVMDCVAEDEDHAVELAMAIANDRDRREALRQKLLDARGRLVEDVAAAAELENALVRLARMGPSQGP